MQCTLVGFSVELDWRPLRFVEPIPDHWVCSACGLVRKRTALLSCTHTLCESCYDQCAQDGVRVCPLDGHRCEDNDIDLRDIDADDLLKREVMCWNERRGCNVVLPASKIALHFQRECQHHSVRCSKCSAQVLCTDVCTHFETECSNTATPVAPECERASGFKDNEACLTSLKQALEGHINEIKDLQEQLLSDNAVNSCQISIIDHCVDSCQDVLKKLRRSIDRIQEEGRQELVQATSKHDDYVENFFGEVFREEKKKQSIDIIYSTEKLLKDESVESTGEQYEKVTQVAERSAGAKDDVTEGDSGDGLVKAVLLKPSHQVTVCDSDCEFIIKDVQSLIKQALCQNSSMCSSDEVCLEGYCMSLGVEFVRDEFIALRMRFLLHKGDMDDLLLWPFIKRMKMCVLHPNGQDVCEVEETVCGCCASCKQPDESEPQHPFRSRERIYFHTLYRDGYVKNDQLRVKFEVFPP